MSNKSIQSGGSHTRSQAAPSHAARPPVRARDYSRDSRGRFVEPRYRYSRSYSYHWGYQPSIWPGYIPHSYFWNGLAYNLIWSAAYGGYGWYGPGHVWYGYDQVVQQPVTDPNGQPTVVYTQSPGPSFGSVLLYGVGGMTVLFILVCIISML